MFKALPLKSQILKDPDNLECSTASVIRALSKIFCHDYKYMKSGLCYYIFILIFFDSEMYFRLFLVVYHMTIWKFQVFRHK